MKKLFALLVLLVTLLVSLIPGIATATTYNNDTPTGSMLLAWSTTPNQGGKNTVINFLYSGGFRSSMGIDAPFDSSWHSLDDVRPILLAEQEGYGNYLGGTNGAFGTKINFAPNVLATMKVQNFNPSQVGGADIPPSSTTLNSDEIAWLQKGGYTVQSTSQSTSTSTPTPTPAPTPQPQSQPQPSKQTTSTQSSTTSTQPQQSTSSTGTSSKTSNPAIGQTVKTPSGQMTQEMVAADQKLVAQNPPSLNPANILIKEPVNKETSTKRNVWIWIAAGALILALIAVAGRIIYARHRTV